MPADCHSKNIYITMYISDYDLNHYHGEHNENITLLLYNPSRCSYRALIPWFRLCLYDDIGARSMRTINRLSYRWYTYLLSLISDRVGRGRDVGWSLGGFLHYLHPRSRLFAILLLIIISMPFILPTVLV